LIKIVVDELLWKLSVEEWLDGCECSHGEVQDCTDSSLDSLKRFLILKFSDLFCIHDQFCVTVAMNTVLIDTVPTTKSLSIPNTHKNNREIYTLTLTIAPELRLSEPCSVQFSDNIYVSRKSNNPGL